MYACSRADRLLRPQGQELTRLVRQLLYTATAALVIACCCHGAGQPPAQLDPDDVMMGTQLFFVAELLYGACTVPIKASICTTLVRLAGAPPPCAAVRWTLHSVTAVSAGAVVVLIVGVAHVCHPISALWGEAATAADACSPALYHAVGSFFCAVCVATDWTLALLPAALLWDVRMQARVRLGVGLMLALGTLRVPPPFLSLSLSLALGAAADRSPKCLLRHCRPPLPPRHRPRPVRVSIQDRPGRAVVLGGGRHRHHGRVFACPTAPPGPAFRQRRQAARRRAGKRQRDAAGVGKPAAARGSRRRCRQPEANPEADDSGHDGRTARCKHGGMGTQEGSWLGSHVLLASESSREKRD